MTATKNILFIKKLFFFPIGFVLWSPLAVAKTVDISYAYRCDAIFTTQGCTGGTEENSRVRDSVIDGIGIVVPSTRGTIPPLRRQVITIVEGSRLVEATSKLSAQQTSQKLAENTGTTGQGAGPLSSDENPNQSNNNTQGTTASRDNGLNMGAPTTPDYSRNQQLKAGGFLYADDEPDNAAAAGPTAESIGTGSQSLLGQSQASGEAAVKANRKNAGVEENSPFNPVASGGGGFGQFESGSAASPVNPGIVEKVTDGLASIAGSLGEKFFGALGGRGKGKQGSQASLAANKLKNKAALKKGLNLDKNLLKRGLARFNAQGTNSLEFGSAQSFLFHSMCNHYVAYARNNRIPNDRSPCPRK